MKASSDPDTFYYHEAMREPDSKQFQKAMEKEVWDHTKNNHWEFMEKRDVPEDEMILPAVWAMKRKRRISTQQTYKWKSRLNLGGHKMVKGKHYDRTDSPVISWPILRLFLILSLMFKWHTRQIDFVLAYPQADIPRPTFMELPRGINIKGYERNKHCLRVTKNLYGGKDSGRTWYLHLKKGLATIGFHPSENDDCVFYRGTTAFLVYVDDGILIDPDKRKVDKAIKDMQTIFKVEDEGSLEDYLGVHVTQHPNQSIELTQPHLIDSILKDLNLLDENGKEHKRGATGKDLPALSSRLIGPDPKGIDFDYNWDYASVIGKLNFLEKSTRPEIAYAVHQCARFSHNTKRSHGEAVKHLGRYLLKTRTKGYILKPAKEHSFQCWVDADFCGNWDRTIAGEDPDTARSRTGFIIMYAGAPLYWESKLQTQIALSTAESELIALSSATRQCRWLMNILSELKERGVEVDNIPEVRCRCYEDNEAALQIATLPKMRPRTRHLNAIYHHFRAELAHKRLRIKILPIDTTKQLGDGFTKPVPAEIFYRHREKIMGW